MRHYEEAQASLVERTLQGELRDPDNIWNQDLGAVTPVKPSQRQLQTSWSRNEPSWPSCLSHTLASKWYGRCFKLLNFGLTCYAVAENEIGTKYHIGCEVNMFQMLHPLEILFLCRLLKDAVWAVSFLLLLFSHLWLTSPFSVLETTPQPRWPLLCSLWSYKWRSAHGHAVGLQSELHCGISHSGVIGVGGPTRKSYKKDALLIFLHELGYYYSF